MRSIDFHFCTILPEKHNLVFSIFHVPHHFSCLQQCCGVVIYFCICAHAFKTLLCIFCIHKHIKVSSHDDHSTCLCNRQRQHKTGTERCDNNCIYIEVLGVPLPVDQGFFKTLTMHVESLRFECSQPINQPLLHVFPHHSLPSFPVSSFLSDNAKKPERHHDKHKKSVKVFKTYFSFL